MSKKIIVSSKKTGKKYTITKKKKPRGNIRRTA